MRLIGHIAWHDFRTILSQREAQVWIFVMPLAFIFFIGTATAPRSSGPPRIAVWNQDSGFLSQVFSEHLESFGYKVEPVTDAEELARYTRQITLPADFTERVLAAQQADVMYRRGGDRDSRSVFDEVKVRRAVYSLVAVVARAAQATGGQLDEPSVRAALAEPRRLTLDVQDAGKPRQIPAGFLQAVPGILVMFVMMSVLTSGVAQLVEERRSGVLRRLASAPGSRATIVLGKMGGRLGVAVVQITYMMLIGRYIFSVSWGEHLAALILLLFVYALAVILLGLWLGSLMRTIEQAIGIGVTTSMALAALGGAWWPIEIVPQYLQRVAMALPTGWVMDAIHQLVAFNNGPEAIVGHIAALLAAAAVFAALAARSFRFV